ncbi:MAG: isochorismatase [Acidobacteriota bacterium]
MRKYGLAALLACVAAAPAADLRLPLRSRVEPFKGSGVWREVRFEQSFPVKETAILICDMWDKHWCQGASARVEVLARKMAPLIERARKRGLLIIHAPSDTMAFYKEHPARERVLAIAKAEPPALLVLPDPRLPIDDSDGGCDTPEKSYKAWTRQHAAIRIDERDAISDNGLEVYSLMRQAGVRNLFIMGVHTNMCVLNRTFAIKRMTRWGVPCVLVRDLTDAMYDPQDPPHVSHERGTELVVEHIEKHWCPTVLSADLMRALGR